MEKIGKVKITDDVKKIIIDIHEKDKTKTCNVINKEIFAEHNIDLSYFSINKTINNYYKERGEIRPLISPYKNKKEKKPLTDEQKKELLLSDYKQGRPLEIILKIAKKYGIEITDEDIENTLKEDKNERDER